MNGQTGGTVGIGTITGTGLTATYIAPGAAPMQNPVAVSCELNRARGTNLAIANVLVRGEGWAGEVSWTLMGMQSDSDATTERRWTVSGEGRITVGAGQLGSAQAESATSSYNYVYPTCARSTQPRQPRPQRRPSAPPRAPGASATR